MNSRTNVHLLGIHLCMEFTFVWNSRIGIHVQIFMYVNHNLSDKASVRFLDCLQVIGKCVKKSGQAWQPKCKSYNS